MPGSPRRQLGSNPKTTSAEAFAGKKTKMQTHIPRTDGVCAGLYSYSLAPSSLFLSRTDLGRGSVLVYLDRGYTIGLSRTYGNFSSFVDAANNNTYQLSSSERPLQTSSRLATVPARTT
uniref:Uncharacterized protein n=1 Tax=Mycena chlorophos TaxID=658473 RepID=A0ABQ0LV19_MYCCL|nr:predicted protein [Mycena chlorophos]